MLANLLMWTGITIVAYAVSVRLFRMSKSIGLLHPIVLSVVIVFGLLQWTETPIEQYLQGTQILSWLLLPATIALAVPLYNQLPLLRQLGFSVIFPILAGGVVAPLVALGIFWLAGLDITLMSSVATKSITTPLAIETTRIIGGLPSLAAIMVIITGLLGVMISSTVFSFFKIDNEVVKGLALGTAAHALGTAHAANISQSAVGFATLALCINGICTSVFLTLGYWLLSF